MILYSYCIKPTVEKPKSKNEIVKNQNVDVQVTINGQTEYSQVQTKVENGAHGEEGDDHMHFDPKSQSTMRILILVGALSLHAIFEGLVFGLAERVDEVFGTILAVLVHKSIIAFSTGMQLLTSGLPEWDFSLVFFHW